MSEEELRGWFLETLSEGGKLRRVRIEVLPFRVGRRQGLELVLPAESVSKVHAEIYGRGEELRLRDLGSRNGSFVNRVQIEDETLVEGDIVHFADFEFRVGRSDLSESKPESGPFGHSTTVAVKGPELPHRFVGGTREMRELLRENQVTIVFQPIVLLARGTVAAYEALGRSTHPQLDKGPLELLQIAEDIGREGDLSRLFRRKAVELAAQRRDLPTIFLNTHPTEFLRPGLLESLEQLRELAPQLDLALEIHESVLSRAPAIAELRGLLLERNIALAYDDFGAGQARLLELAEAPPHYLKFDHRFISGLDQDQDPLGKRRLLLQSLLTLARELLVKTVAEGIETAGEARVCAEIGFTHAQGFHMGRPRPLAEL